MIHLGGWERVVLAAVAGLVGVCTLAPGAFGQTEGAPPIRVESELVLVPTTVFYKNVFGEIGPKAAACVQADDKIFAALRPTEVYFPKDCENETIRDLTSQEFHVFEDGIEQKIREIAAEKLPDALTRDNYGKHFERSYTPWAKWSSTDLWMLVRPYIQHSYTIAYSPSKHAEGGCHKIKVKVERHNAVVFAREEYCKNSETDPLNGTSLEKQMERDLVSGKTGKIPLYIQAGYIYINADFARIEITLEIPWTRLHREWTGGTFHATIGLLGIAYKKDGSVAARFSDFACCGPGPSIMEAVEPVSEACNLPSRYEAQIDLPPGEYDLQLVLSDGSKFGRIEVPLVVDAYDEKQLALSSVLLCKRFRDATVAAQEAAALKVAPKYIPFVTNGLQLTPTGDTQFAKGERLMAYFEIYEPLLEENSATGVKAHVRIVNPKSGTVEKDYGPLDVACCRKPGSAMIPMGLEVTIDKMPAGTYRLEVQASDAMGHQTGWRSTDFTVQ